MQRETNKERNTWITEDFIFIILFISLHKKKKSFFKLYKSLSFLVVILDVLFVNGAI